MKSMHYYLNTGKRKKILEDRNQEFLSYVCKRTGWSQAQAREEMDKYVKQGVNYRYYVKKRIWSRSGDKLAVSLKNIEKDSRYDKRSPKKHAKLVAKECGLPEGKVIEKILESNLYTECSPRDYYQFRFWEKTADEQKKYLTKGTVERLIMKYNTNPDEINMIRSKDKFAGKFGDLYHRVSFVNRKISFEQFCSKTEGLHELICKPVFGTHGDGVEKFEIPNDIEKKRELYDLLMRKPKSQIEEVIVQHHEIAAFCSTSVNTVRLVTITEGEKVHYAYAALRMGTGALIDGAAGGGLFAPVDLETGTLCGDGINLDMKIFPEHPVSQKVIKGFVIPNWEKVLRLAETAAKRLDGAYLIGWDIAVREEDAVLIEANSEPNYQLAQLPYVAENIGVRYKFEPFL